VNYRRIAAAALTAWLVSIPLGAVIHHGILGRVYATNTIVFRSDAEVMRRLPLGSAVALVGFFIATVMYVQWNGAGKGVAAGLRFGLLIGTLLVSLAVFSNYVTQPISVAIGLAEIVEYLIGSALYGVIIGLVYRPARAEFGQAVRA